MFDFLIKNGFLFNYSLLSTELLFFNHPKPEVTALVPMSLHVSGLSSLLFTFHCQQTNLLKTVLTSFSETYSALLLPNSFQPIFW